MAHDLLPKVAAQPQTLPTKGTALDHHHSADCGVALGNRRILKPGRLRWLRALAWMAALFALVLLSVGPAMALVRHLLPPSTQQLSLVTNILSGLLAVTVYALAVRFGEDRTVDELAIARAPVQLAAGLALGATMFGAVMLLLWSCNLYTVEWLGVASAWRGIGRAIQAGLVEEILVRAIMLRLLWNAFGSTPAFLLSAAFFGISHAFNTGATAASVVCVALEAGVMLGALYALTGRLWLPIGVHTAWNFTQGYVFGAAVSGGDMGPAMAHSVARSDASIYVTGGIFGPEASLPALLICTAVGIVVLWRARERGLLARDRKPRADRVRVMNVAAART